MISHNGEINTLRGNINWMRAREALFASDLYEPGDVEKLLPIIREGLSDTACLDNAVELLVKSGYSLPHAMMMLIPEAWENHETMSQAKKDFYAYHSCLMEPWDGPASIGFTDGKNIGAVLDRNGLRPSRYVVTRDGLVDHGLRGRRARHRRPRTSSSKGRLEPGKMFLVDLEEGRIVDDEELKHAIATAKPYGKWLREYMVPLAELPEAPARPGPRPRDAAPPPAGVRLHARRPQVHPRPDGQQRRGGDRLDGDRHPAGRPLRPRPAAVQLLQAALRAGHQPAARRDPRGAGHVGPHRRRGRGEPARCPTPESCRQIALDMPILDNDELAKLKQLDGWRGFKSAVLPMLFPAAEGAEGLERALDDDVRAGRRGDRGRGQPADPLRPRRRRQARADPVAAGHAPGCTTTWSARGCGPAPAWSSSAATPARSTTSPCCSATAPGRSTRTSRSRRSTT